MSDNTELSILETTDLVPSVIFSEGGSAPIIEKIKNFISSINIDTETAKGRDEIRSIAYKIKRTKTTLDDMGEQVKENAQKIVNAVNKERRLVREELDRLESEFRAPLTEYERIQKEKEDKEIKRVQAHKENLNFYFHVSDMWDREHPDRIKEMIKFAEETITSKYEEFEGEAIARRDIAILKLNSALRMSQDRLDKFEAAEKLRLEVQLQERAARDKQIAEHAAEKAKKDAEEIAAKAIQAERDRADAAIRKAGEEAAKAQQRLKEAKQKAAADKERALQKQEEETQAAAEREKQEKLQQGKIDLKNKKYRQDGSEIIKDIFNILTEFVIKTYDINKAGLAMSQATAVAQAIVDGEIRHVTYQGN